MEQSSDTNPDTPPKVLPSEPEPEPVDLPDMPTLPSNSSRYTTAKL